MFAEMFEKTNNLSSMKPRHSAEGVTWVNAQIRIVDGIYDDYVFRNASTLHPYYSGFANVCSGMLTARPGKNADHVGVMRPSGGLRVADAGSVTILSVPLTRPRGLSDAQYKPLEPNTLNALLANLAVRIALMKGAKSVLISGDKAAALPISGAMVAYGLLSGASPLTNDTETRWADPRHPLVSKMYNPYMHPAGIWGSANADRKAAAALAQMPEFLGFIAPDPLKPSHIAGRRLIEEEENKQLGKATQAGDRSGFAAVKTNRSVKSFDRLPERIKAENIEMYMTFSDMHSTDIERQRNFNKQHNSNHHAYQPDMF